MDVLLSLNPPTCRFELDNEATATNFKIWIESQEVLGHQYSLSYKPVEAYFKVKLLLDAAETAAPETVIDSFITNTWKTLHMHSFRPLKVAQ